MVTAQNGDFTVDCELAVSVYSFMSTVNLTLIDTVEEFDVKQMVFEELLGDFFDWEVFVTLVDQINNT